VLLKLSDLLKKLGQLVIETQAVVFIDQQCSSSSNSGGVCIPMYLGTHIILLKHLVKVTTVLSELNILLKKLGV